MTVHREEPVAAFVEIVCPMGAAFPLDGRGYGWPVDPGKKKGKKVGKKNRTDGHAEAYARMVKTMRLMAEEIMAERAREAGSFSTPTPPTYECTNDREPKEGDLYHFLDSDEAEENRLVSIEEDIEGLVERVVSLETALFRLHRSNQDEFAAPADVPKIESVRNKLGKAVMDFMSNREGEIRIASGPMAVGIDVIDGCGNVIESDTLYREDGTLDAGVLAYWVGRLVSVVTKHDEPTMVVSEEEDQPRR